MAAIQSFRSPCVQYAKRVALIFSLLSVIPPTYRRVRRQNPGRVPTVEVYFKVVFVALESTTAVRYVHTAHSREQDLTTWFPYL